MAAEFARKHANTVVTGLASAAPLLLASQHSGGGAGMETVGLAGLAVGAKFLESSGPLSQNRNLHKEIVDLEREQHKEAQHLQKQQHDAEQKLQRTQHLQDATKDLQESSKEADRDLMDARTERFQNLMMVSSLFLSGCFTLAVEGTLPEDPGTVFGGRCALVDVYYFLLAISIGLNWVTIMCSLRITSRISDYMQKVNPDALLKCRIYSSRPTHESQQKIGHAQTTGSLAEPTVDRTPASARIARAWNLWLQHRVYEESEKDTHHRDVGIAAPQQVSLI